MLASVPPAFCYAVANVVLLATQKQVGRVAARRVIALMKNMKSFGRWPVADFPRDAVRQVTFARKPDAAVSAASGVFFPFPACFGAADRNPSKASAPERTALLLTSDRHKRATAEVAGFAIVVRSHVATSISGVVRGLALAVTGAWSRHYTLKRLNSRTPKLRLDHLGGSTASGMAAFTAGYP
jgi:hypothetical protein